MSSANIRLKGTVASFDVCRGYGFIMPEDSDEKLFVHQTSIKAMGYSSLAVGEAVELVVSTGDDGSRRVVSVTGPGGAYIIGNFGLSSLEEEEEEEINNDNRELSKGVEQRNWADLPRDVLWIIFKKIRAFHIIKSAQFVCRPWRQLSYDPDVWRHIVVTLKPISFRHFGALESLAMLAVDRSQGCVEDFYLQDFLSHNDELIGYMSERTTKLRRLRLVLIYKMSDTILAQAIRSFSLLEELEISFCLFSSKIVEVIGPACPQLKSFKLNKRPNKHHYNIQYVYENSDTEAFSIAKHMQQLQRLQLIGNSFTEIGLLAILNNCLNLQSLDIRACLNICFNENMRRKCSKIKELRSPYDSTDDFEFSEFIGDLSILDFNYYDTDSDDE